MMNTFTLIPLAVAFWQLGNKQIFENMVIPIATINNIPLTGHHLLQDIITVRIGDPRLLPGIVFVLVLSAILWKFSFKEA